jgi:hypothetical protein
MYPGVPIIKRNSAVRKELKRESKISDDQAFQLLVRKDVHAEDRRYVRADRRRSAPKVRHVRSEGEVQCERIRNSGPAVGDGRSDSIHDALEKKALRPEKLPLSNNSNPPETLRSVSRAAAVSGGIFGTSIVLIMHMR